MTILDEQSVDTLNKIKTITEICEEHPSIGFYQVFVAVCKATTYSKKDIIKQLKIKNSNLRIIK